MDFRILGPLDVRAGERPIALGAAKQRALLALLLLRAGEVVSTEQIIDELWGESPPQSAVKLVQTYVSRLRRALADEAPQAIVTRPPGYLAAVQPGQPDADRFRRSVADAREAVSRRNPEEASRLFAEGLALWRGRPAEDVVLNRHADSEIDRLEELRAAARAERLAVELELGRHTGAIGELKALVADDPFAERPRALLMLALYRAGRQAESLKAFRDARAALVDELGVEPGAELQDLHRRILDQDPTLDLPRGSAPQPATAPERRATRSRRTTLLLAAAGLAIAAGLVAILVIGGDGEAPRLAPDEVGLVASSGDDLTETVAVGRRPAGIAVSGETLWTANLDDRTVSEVDLGDGSVVDSIGTRTAPTALAASPLAVWVVQQFADRLERIDARTGRVDAAIPVGTTPVSVALGYGSVWVANRGDRTVSRIDPSTLRVTVIRVGPGPSGIATGAGGVWVSEGLAHTVVLIDPARNRVTTRIGVRYTPGAITTGAGHVWVASPFDDAVSRIDPQSGVDATVHVGDEPAAIVFADGGVWVADQRSREVQRIDPVTAKLATIPLEANPTALASGEGGVWVAGSGP
jgi:DNA-binding SARP family transcriptional activator/streptogramin lyase